VTYRPSIAERIAWTSGFYTSSDSRVLAVLASFAHFETGANAHPTVERLQARVPDLSLRTIARCLVRLERDGWIEGVRHHRRPTNYRICVERLATRPTMAKVIASNPNLDCHRGSQREDFLTATVSPLTATVSDLTATVAVHPSTYPDQYPSAPTLRVGLFTANENTTKPEKPEEAKVETIDAAPPTAGGPDLRANREADSDDAAGGPAGPGGDQAAAPLARLHLQERSDSSRIARDHAAPEPQQLSFGPHDISARHANVQKTITVLREAIDAAKRKNG
jgi:hypothetical protein